MEFLRGSKYLQNYNKRLLIYTVLSYFDSCGIRDGDEPKPLLINIADKKALLKSSKLVLAPLDD
jgi:hypothetical protein